MTNQNFDIHLDGLVRSALVPKGYRPIKNSDIEKLLDTIEEEPISEEKKQRMLRKIRGQEPVFQDRTYPESIITTDLTAQEKEFVTLHRAKNRPLPPDLAAKLKEMEKRASKKPKSGEDTHGV